jgi:hypothetical protein
MEASMTLPNQYHQPLGETNEPIDDSLQYPAPEHTHFAPDAPPLRADDDDRPEAYDPVWTGQGQVGPSDAVAQTDLERIEQILNSEHFRMRRRRAPDFVPPPPPPAPQKRAGVSWAVGTFALLVGASAFIAYQMSGRVPLLDSTADTSSAVTRVASLFASAPPANSELVEETPPAAPAAAPPAPPPAPLAKAHLVVTGASADSPDRILLGIGVENASEGMNAVIGGLAPGTTLTSGRPWGSTGWILPAAELATAYLRPPAGFTGVMEYSVALQRPDNSVIDRQTMRLEWTAPTAEQPQPPAPQTEARNLTPDEIASMLSRGERLLMEGDIASARLLLQRAADAQDARAAFALAGSYDPIELKRLGVYGAAPDLVKARDWYEKARQYGSREAPKRLELLASQFR